MFPDGIVIEGTQTVGFNPGADSVAAVEGGASMAQQAAKAADAKTKAAEEAKQKEKEAKRAALLERAKSFSEHTRAKDTYDAARREGFSHNEAMEIGRTAGRQQ